MTARVAAERNDALLTWYRERKRRLPWRDVGDPYPVLVSEVMLQQTQVSRVIPYYQRFLSTFPTVEALAGSSLGEVLAVWSDLGYNTRAQRLRDAARVVIDGGWPATVAGLRDLPGVGRYTAAAIASFAFGTQIAAVDTNMRRVLSRWHGEPLDGSGLQAAADADLGIPAGDWNQAMMDLAATLCRPRQPSCSACPVEAWCSGPHGYAPPPPQSRFEGSARQLRGCIIRAVVRRPQSFDQIHRETGFPTEEIEIAIADLEAEGLIRRDEASRWQIGK
jgi:A/G-specific adenine glycosylase